MKAAGVAESISVPFQAGSLESASVGHLVLEQYDREQLSLRRYLAFLGLDPEAARDVVHDSFVRLQQHLMSDGDRTNLRAWLYRVAHNLARNQQTAFRESKTDALPEPVKGGPFVTDITPEDELLEKEQERRLKRGMEQLNPAQRQCMVLRAQGFKYREIAEVLELSVSTVGENVQRGLAKLKELL